MSLVIPRYPIWIYNFLHVVLVPLPLYMNIGPFVFLLIFTFHAIRKLEKSHFTRKTNLMFFWKPWDTSLDVYTSRHWALRDTICYELSFTTRPTQKVSYMKSYSAQMLRNIQWPVRSTQRKTLLCTESWRILVSLLRFLRDTHTRIPTRICWRTYLPPAPSNVLAKDRCAGKGLYECSFLCIKYRSLNSIRIITSACQLSRGFCSN